MEHGISDIVIKIGDAHIDFTIEIMSWLVMGFLIICSFLISARLNRLPGKLQNIFEMIVTFLNDIAVNMIGPRGKQYVPLVGTIFLYVLFSNWVGLIPGNLIAWCTEVGPQKEIKFMISDTPVEIDWSGIEIKPPTSNVNTPLALAIVAVLYYNYSGIRATGLKKYLMHHVGPIPELAKEFSLPLAIILLPPLTLLFLLINIMEHISRTFSLTVRLFCNIMGEHSVLAALIAVMIEIIRVKGLSLMALPILIPIPLIVMGLGLLTGAIQALIFALLTFSYISSVAGEHH